MDIETKKLISNSNKLLNILIEEKENNKKYEQEVLKKLQEKVLLDIEESMQELENLKKNNDKIKNIDKIGYIILFIIGVISLTAFFIVAILR